MLSQLQTFFKKNRYVIWSIFATIFCAVLISRGLWQEALPKTYDIHHHASRVANYYVALTEGQFPPRWAPTLYSNFGYPIFIFMYPLPYILSVPLFMITNSIEWSVNLLLIFSIISSAIGSWLVAFILTKKSKIACIAALLYATSPYFLVTIFVKGAVAEALFIGLLPWVWSIFLTLHNQKKLWWQIFSYAAIVMMLLSHHLSLMIAAPLFIVWLIFISRAEFFNGKGLKVLYNNRNFLLLSFFGLLTTMFFWIPLIAEKNFTIIGSEKSITTYYKDFAQPANLIWSTKENSILRLGAFNERFSTMIGIPSLFIVLFSMATLWASGRKKSFQTVRPYLFFWAAIFSATVFLMVSPSRFIWELFSPLQNMQFPWRLLWLAVFSSFMLYLYLEKSAVTNTFVKRLSRLLIITFAGFSIIFWARPESVFHEGNHVWLEYPHSSTSFDELTPMWFKLAKNGRLTDKVVLREQGTRLFSLEDEQQRQYENFGSITVLHWTGSRMEYSISTPLPSEIIQRTAFFPGWKVEVNGVPTEISFQDEEFPGRIVIPVSAGEHHIVAKFTNDTWARKLGDALSIVGVIAFIFQLIFGGYSQLHCNHFKK